MVGCIKSLCDNSGVTFAELERSLGFGNGTIARWDEKCPSVTRVKAVADYFGVTVDDLLSDSEAAETGQ